MNSSISKPHPNIFKLIDLLKEHEQLASISFEKANLGQVKSRRTASQGTALWGVRRDRESNARGLLLITRTSVEAPLPPSFTHCHSDTTRTHFLWPPS
jgi:hypothetical protein